MNRPDVTQAEADLAEVRGALDAADAELAATKAKLADEPNDKNAAKAEAAKRERDKAALMLEAHETRFARAISAEHSARKDAVRTEIEAKCAVADVDAVLACMRPDLERLVDLEAEVERVAGRLMAVVRAQRVLCREIDDLAPTAGAARAMVGVEPLRIEWLHFVVGIMVEHARAKRGTHCLDPHAPYTWLIAYPEPAHHTRMPDGSPVPASAMWNAVREQLGIGRGALPPPRVEHENRVTKWPWSPMGSE